MRAGAEWVGITSFNEWHEGTQVCACVCVCVRKNEMKLKMKFINVYPQLGHRRLTASCVMRELPPAARRIVLLH